LSDRKRIQPVKAGFVGDDELTEAFHVLQLQLSPPPLSSLAPMKSRMETFWYRLTQIYVEKWPLRWRVVVEKWYCAYIV